MVPESGSVPIPQTVPSSASDDYNNVARSIVAKYPFMKSPTGKPYISII